MNRKPGDWNCPSCDHLNFGWRESCQRCSEPKSGGDAHAKSGDGGYGGGRDDDRGDSRRRGSSYGFGSGYNSSSGGSSYYGRSDSRGSDYRGGYRDDYRSSYGGSDAYSGRSFGSGYGGSDVRPGDWHCQERGCGAHNFASRNSCFKCGAGKDEGDANGGGSSYDYGRSGGYDRGSRGAFGKSYDSGEGAGGGGNRAGWKSGDWMCTRSGCNEHNFASRTECFRCQTPREATPST